MSPKRDRARIESLAEKYIKKQKYQEAITEYQKLLSGDDQDIPIKNIIGDLYIKDNQTDLAVKEFKKIADHFEDKGVFTKTIAIYKRITRLAPDDVDSLWKLADLYSNRGFRSEAKTEYQKLAKKLGKKGKTKEAIKTYEKLLKLDPENVEARLSLAELLDKEGMVDRAIEELNEAAELKMFQNDLKKAREFLNKARSLKEDHSRTLENCIDLFKRENKKKEALKLVNEVLRKDKENTKALYLLGNLCFEDKEYKKAEEIFKTIVSLQPKELEARIRLGRIHIQNQDYDKALEMYEPLINALLKKRKEDKAIGLLGLILTAKKDHLPSLERLAMIYKERAQKKNLEIVYKRLVKEYQKRNLKQKLNSLQEELSGFVSVKEEYRRPHEEKEEKEERGEEPAASEAPDETGGEKAQGSEGEPEDIIEQDLAKADLYIEQGLLRNAKRILENLRMRFPDEERIGQKIKELAILASEVKEEELVDRIEKVAKRETEMFTGGEKLTAAEIFADTDIVPLISQETGEKKYFNLSVQIKEELEAIKHIYYQQTRGDTTVVEKELSAIVTEFKDKVEEKIGTADLETRFNLGIAYMEQGLIDDALKEFMLASQDRRYQMECFTNLGECFKRKNQPEEARKWFEKALGNVGDDSIQAFALKYEIAALYEEFHESDMALKLYNEVKAWNPEYGDVAEKIKSLEKQPSK